MIKTSIILPAFNEELSIKKTIDDFKKCFPNAPIVVVDNNSKDKTIEVAKKLLNPNSDKIFIEKKRGKGNALKNAFSKVDSDIYIMADADGTYYAQDALKLLNILIQERLDLVIGDRISNNSYKNQNKRFGHNIGNYLFNKIISFATGYKFKDSFSGLRVMGRPFVKSFDFESEGFQIETEMCFKIAYLGADTKEVPINYGLRPLNSKSKLNSFIDGYKISRFIVNNLIFFRPTKFFKNIFIVFFLITILTSFKALYGFITTDLPYIKTSIVAATFLLLTIMTAFFGFIVKIISDQKKSTLNLNFLNEKRKYNTILDDNL